MYKQILIGTDGSELGDKALTHGMTLAKAVGAKVTIVTATGCELITRDVPVDVAEIEALMRA